MSSARVGRARALLFALALLLSGVKTRTTHAQAAGTAKPPAPSPIRFIDAIQSSKIGFFEHSSTSAQRYLLETMTGGVAAFDYDNDGLLDLFFTNGAAVPSLTKTGPEYWNRLYHNNGDGTFTDVTEKAGVPGLVGGKKGWSVTAGWFDYNHDGKLDLLVVNYLDYNVKTAALCSTQKLPTYCSPDDFQGLPNILYRNNGDGIFTDVSVASHIAQFPGKGMGVAFADYDRDGNMDIFVSNDTFPNTLLHNNGDGTFTDDATMAGVAFKNNGKTVAGMGADFRDLDNDGKPDIFHTAMYGDGFPLYRNLGEGQFEEVTGAAGLTGPTSRLTAWGAGIFDFDNDGLKDIFTSNSAILDNALEIEHRPYELADSLFRNLGRMRFEDVSALAGPDFARAAAHRGAAFGDFNNDGKIDIAVSVLNGPPQLLLNRTENANHWILLKLVGVADNRDGLGTEVKITTAHGVQFNVATTAVGYNSSSDKRVHFGLGDAATIDRIELTWPTGIKQVLTNVHADQVLTVVEPSK